MHAMSNRKKQRRDSRMDWRERMGVPFIDLGGPNGVPEDVRITMITEQLGKQHTVGVVVDLKESEKDKPGTKGDRYIKKLLERNPAITVISRTKAPAQGIEVIKVAMAGLVN